MTNRLPTTMKSSDLGPPDILNGPLEDRLDHASRDAAWGQICANEAYEWARLADRHHRATTELHPDRRPLLRVGVKDNVSCAPFATRLGTSRYREYPSITAPVLRDGIEEYVTCKTQLTELTLGLESGCVHPHNPKAWTGASSAGSAVAVATNICDLALGTDSLGSLRIPAIANGVVSIRLTHNPALLQGVLKVSPTFDAVGWLTRDLDDMAFAADHLNLLPPQNSQVGRTQAQPRLALAREVLNDATLAPSIRRAYLDLEKAAVNRGAEVIWIDLGRVWEFRMTSWAVCAFETAQNLGPRLTELAPYGTEIDNVIASGGAVNPSIVETLYTERVRLQRETEALFRSFDIDAIAMPAYPFTLPDRAQIAQWPMLFPDFHDTTAPDLSGYAPIGSILGWPVLTVPYGGTQVGMQFMSAPNTEQFLIERAQTILR